MIMSSEYNRDDEIIEEYKNGSSIRTLEKKFHVHRLTIKKIIEGNGLIYRNKSVAHQKIKINSNYFEKIDSSSKAYFLGFIYADGNVYKNHLKIDINKKDINLLKVFLQELESDHKIYIYKDNVSINISNQKIKSDLNSLGVFPRKTYNMNFPENNQVPEKYIRHFIRGYFDGDGSIQLHNYEHPIWRFTFMAPENFCQKIIEILEQNCNIKLSQLQDKRVSVDMKTLYLSKSVRPSKIINLKKVYDYLYNDSDIFLERKKNIFEQIFETAKKYEDYNNERKQIIFNGITYKSIREAAKNNNISYSKFRTLIKKN